MQASTDQERTTDLLDYVASMLRELRLLAHTQNYDMLAYLIDMAQLEASDLICAEKASIVRREQRDSAA